jgi:putative oxidoreductase
MSDADVNAINVVLLILRLGVAAVFLAHGIRHIFGGGKIAGTGRWFESLGVRPGIVHAWVASVAEVAAGAGLVLGFLTPLCAAAVIGTMLVAWITNHWKNGFWVFHRPDEGYEYVMTLTFVGLALGTIGPGEWSVDHAIWDKGELIGTTGLWLSLLGAVAALLLLATSWRPNKPSA